MQFPTRTPKRGRRGRPPYTLIPGAALVFAIAAASAQTPVYKDPATKNGWLRRASDVFQAGIARATCRCGRR